MTMSFTDYLPSWLGGTDTFKPSSLQDPVLSSGPIDVAQYFDDINWDQKVDFIDIPEITVTADHFDGIPLTDRFLVGVKSYLPSWLGGNDTGTAGNTGAGAVKNTQMATFVAVAALGLGVYFIAKGAK